MASSIPPCGICDLRHVTKESNVWCPECDEGLCKDCQEHHGLSKSSRNHSTLLITDYLKLPASVLSITEYCDKHNEKFTAFCKQHQCPCCRQCLLSDHETCTEKTILETIVQHVKTSNWFVEMEHTVDEMLDSIIEIRKEKEDNAASIQVQRTLLETKIKETKIKIISHLDKIEKEALRELATATTKVLDKTNNLFLTLDKHKKELQTFQSDLKSVKQYASNLQAFLARKHIETDVTTIEKSLRALENDDSLLKTHLTCDVDANLFTIMAKVKTFGKVVMKSTPSQIKLSRNAKYAQIMRSNFSSFSIDKIKVYHKQTLDTKLQTIRGCVMLPDERLAFSSYTLGNIKIMNKDGSESNKVEIIGEFENSVFDITYIEDSNTIAATSGQGDSRYITIVDLENLQLKKKLLLQSNPYGIAAMNKKLYFSTKTTGSELQTLHLCDDSISVLNSHESYFDASGFSYVAAFQNKLYCTVSSKNEVLCLDCEGKLHWKFSDAKVLVRPLGIDVDNYGYVYVVGNSESNVVVIAPDGKRCRKLLSRRDGLKGPWGIHYKRSTNQILVANGSGSAFLFDVSH